MASKAGIAGSSYAKTSAELMALMNELRASGAAQDFGVPRICVIGNQSSGKSSALEAISGIRLPKADETCTKCPSEIRLKQSGSEEPWKCQISLRFEIDEDGESVNDVTEIPFGKEILDPSLVQVVLRKAQLAILNPKVDASAILAYDSERMEEIAAGAALNPNHKSLSFSSNVIVIDILGPEIVNLTLIDLPGIISNPGLDKQNDIKLITDLVINSIADSSCIILLVITMLDDMENQSAESHARNADPLGNRTIGLLTKADMVQNKQHEKWFKLLRNQSKHDLKLEWYCTKQPNLEELESDPSFERSRLVEQDHFKTGVWANSGLSNRFGIDNLTIALSSTLTQLIRDILPSMTKAAHSALLINILELSLLPPAPSNDPLSELQQILYAFSTEINSYSKGSVRTPDLIQNSRKVYNDFKLNLSATEPTFIAKSREEYVQEMSTEWYDSDSDSGEERTEEIEEETEISKVSMNGVKISRRKRRQLAPLLGNQMNDLLLAMNLSDVSEHIAKSLTRELPLSTPYASISTLIELSLKSWRSIANDLVEKLRPIVFTVVEMVLDKHFSRYSAGPVRNIAGNVVRAEIEKLFDNAEKHVDWILSLEDTPFTLNEHYLSVKRDLYLARFKQTRQLEEISQDEDAQAEAIAALANMKLFTEVSKLPRLLDSDIFQGEIDVMAFCRAYFKVTYKRFLDNIPRALDRDIIRELSNACQMPLHAALGLGSPNATEQASLMLAESPDVVGRREELMKKKARLESAKKALSSFGMAH